MPGAECMLNGTTAAWGQVPILIGKRLSNNYESKYGDGGERIIKYVNANSKLYWV